MHRQQTKADLIKDRGLNNLPKSSLSLRCKTAGVQHHPQPNSPIRVFLSIPADLYVGTQLHLGRTSFQSRSSCLPCFADLSVTFACPRPGVPIWKFVGIMHVHISSPPLHSHRRSMVTLQVITPHTCQIWLGGLLGPSSPAWAHGLASCRSAT